MIENIRMWDYFAHVIHHNKKSSSRSHTSEKIITPVKKKARHSKHPPIADAISQAAKRLRVTHLFATATTQNPAYNKKFTKFLEEFIVSLEDKYLLPC